MNKLTDYDFLGSIYKNTKVAELKETFESIRNQTHKPKNIVLVFDGWIEKEVFELVKKYKKIIPVKIVNIENNVGLGIALRRGLLKCESEIVLRFDTDDINLQIRAELIIRELEKGDVDIVGSNIYEFSEEPRKWISIKRMPLTHKSISRTILFRNPINHPSVGFKRESILKLNGGYRHFPFYEDYDLWIRALFNGLKFRNIDKALVGLRITGQRARRRGIKHISSEYRLFLTFLNHSFLHGLFFIPSLIARVFIILLPLKILNILFLKFLRKSIKKEKNII